MGCVCRIILTVTDLKSGLKVVSVNNWARRIFRYLRIERFVKNVKEFWSVSGCLISTFPQIQEKRSPWLFFIQNCTNAIWLYYHIFPFSKKGRTCHRYSAQFLFEKEPVIQYQVLSVLINTKDKYTHCQRNQYKGAL